VQDVETEEAFYRNKKGEGRHEGRKEVKGGAGREGKRIKGKESTQLDGLPPVPNI